MHIKEKDLRQYLKSKSYSMSILSEIKAIATPDEADTEGDDLARIAEIAEIVKSRRAREHFAIHDVLTFGDLEYEVIGFDHDKDADDETAPTMTLMCKTLTAPHRMHGGACENGWTDTELRAWLNNEYINELPDELVPYIRNTARSVKNYKGEVFQTIDRLFVPTESEVFGSAIWSEHEDGPRYEAFATSRDRVRFDEDGDRSGWWLSSAGVGNSALCADVGSDGGADYATATGSSIRAPLCFCI
jgi:hypothetical protein